MSVAIKIENLSKQYRLGLVSTKTLSHDLNRWWQISVLHKEDPYLRIGETNIRESKANSEYVWALRDINLEVEQGEVLGIIGKNGAGKSTLLKILSKVTSPTTGVIKARGRIASLLEVGTGFHQEMTGRENIFMNGAIMGMTKAEIRKKFDEIVDFAGVERYIDTPVKRYSSGMTVRLGFSVAAHLEPEILVVDEVLAVGDAEFQKKAVGKMKQVSEGKGRTVLFVSHNMVAIKNLCPSAILLQNGQISFKGSVNQVIDRYIEDSGTKDTTCFENKSSTKPIFIESFSIIRVIETGKPFAFEVVISSNLNIKVEFAVGFRLQDSSPIFHIYSGHVGTNFTLHRERNVIQAEVERLPLASGKYEINLWLGAASVVFDAHPSALCINVREGAIRSNGPVSTKNGYPVISDAIWKQIE